MISDKPEKLKRYKQKEITCTGIENYSWDNEKWEVRYEKKDITEKEVHCTVNFDEYFTLYQASEIGDYVFYVPQNKNYTIGSNLTGCTGSANPSGHGGDSSKSCSTSQSIKPDELNLWRIINKNNDGTVTMISEHVSSNLIFFQGKAGYENFIGSLNTIARAYETSGITVSSRHMGYNGQTQSVTVSASTSKPWADNTTSSNSPNGSTREKNGGGDTGYITDFNLVKQVLGTTVSTKPNNVIESYWISSRSYYQGYSNGMNYFFYANRHINTSGNLDWKNMYWYMGGWGLGSHGHAIRPIVTLKSELAFSNGNGEGNNPWTI